MSNTLYIYILTALTTCLHPYEHSDVNDSLFTFLTIFVPVSIYPLIITVILTFCVLSRWSICRSYSRGFTLTRYFCVTCYVSPSLSLSIIRPSFFKTKTVSYTLPHYLVGVLLKDRQWPLHSQTNILSTDSWKLCIYHWESQINRGTHPNKIISSILKTTVSWSKQKTPL